jgi:hypothetical protein
MARNSGRILVDQIMVTGSDWRPLIAKAAILGFSLYCDEPFLICSNTEGPAFPADGSFGMRLNSAVSIGQTLLFCKLANPASAEKALLMVVNS